jgi:hypothetical protein
MRHDQDTPESGGTALPRFAYLAAALLLLSSAVHLVVYAVDGGAWGGPVSWRKPILFGFSFGVTLLSLGWVAGRVGLTRRGGRAFRSSWRSPCGRTAASTGHRACVSPCGSD